MIDNIILPICMILGGIFYLRYLYKRDGGFLKDESMLSNVYIFKGWGIGFIVVIAGICFLIKGIINQFF